MRKRWTGSRKASGWQGMSQHDYNLVNYGGAAGRGDPTTRRPPFCRATAGRRHPPSPRRSCFVDTTAGKLKMRRGRRELGHRSHRAGATGAVPSRSLKYDGAAWLAPGATFTPQTDTRSGGRGAGAPPGSRSARRPARRTRERAGGRSAYRRRLLRRVLVGGGFGGRRRQRSNNAQLAGIASSFRSFVSCSGVPTPGRLPRQARPRRNRASAARRAGSSPAVQSVIEQLTAFGGAESLSRTISAMGGAGANSRSGSGWRRAGVQGAPERRVETTRHRVATGRRRRIGLHGTTTPADKIPATAQAACVIVTSTHKWHSTTNT